MLLTVTSRTHNRCRREQVMMQAMPEAILALAAANFSAGSEFGNVVRQNVGKARVKVSSA